MEYILRIKRKSKYFGFVKIEYKEFETYSKCIIYVCENNIKANMFEIYRIVR